MTISEILQISVTTRSK